MRTAWIAITLGTLVAFRPSFCIADEKPVPPPGEIRLLQGYVHTRLQGIDTSVGRISKKGGVTISYDIGTLAGNYAKSHSKDARWYREQTVAGAPVQIAFSKTGTVFITFPKSSANFYAQIKTPEQLADVLLMVLTFPKKNGAKKDGK